MKYILCYGDSNTWGLRPDRQQRYGFAERWPGVLQHQLGSRVHIYENGLINRTSGFTDEVEPGRNGRSGFQQVMELSAPVDLVILMLGTNDCKKRFLHHPAWDSALHIRQLVSQAHCPQYGPDGIAAPHVLVIAPPVLGQEWEKVRIDLAGEFDRRSTEKSGELAAVYAYAAQQEGAVFMDANDYVRPGGDCVHLTAASHMTLGQAVAHRAGEMLGLSG